MPLVHLHDLIHGTHDPSMDNLKLRWLMKTFPEYMRKIHDDYERRLVEDKEFREEQEAEARRLKSLCLKEFGEEWVKENWRD